MKYNDGKYHIEYCVHETDKDTYAYWIVVNVYGEVCFNENRNYIFGNLTEAENECSRLNECPDGAIFNNLT